MDTYFTTFFDYLQYMMMTTKTDELAVPLLDILQAILNTSSKPLYNQFVHSMLFAYLYHIQENPALSPILMNNLTFTRGLNSIMQSREPITTMSTSHQSILSFLREENTEILKERCHQVVLDFQNLLSGLNILDVCCASTLLQLIQEIISVFNKDGNQDALRIKLQMISLACFAESENGKIGARSLMDYINVLLFQFCPAVNVEFCYLY